MVKFLVIVLAATVTVPIRGLVGKVGAVVGKLTPVPPVTEKWPLCTLALPLMVMLTVTFTLVETGMSMSSLKLMVRVALCPSSMLAVPAMLASGITTLGFMSRRLALLAPSL